MGPGSCLPLRLGESEAALEGRHQARVVYGLLGFRGPPWGGGLAQLGREVLLGPAPGQRRAVRVEGVGLRPRPGHGHGRRVSRTAYPAAA